MNKKAKQAQTATAITQELIIYRLQSSLILFIPSVFMPCVNDVCCVYVKTYICTYVLCDVACREVPSLVSCEEEEYQKTTQVN